MIDIQFSTTSLLSAHTQTAKDALRWLHTQRTAVGKIRCKVKKANPDAATHDVLREAQRQA